VGGFSQALSGLATAGTGTNNTVTDSGVAATLTITTSNFLSYTGVLTGANLSLIKDGSGTLVLAGENGYGGTTTVKAGRLRITTNDALGASGSAAGTTVTPGAVLQVLGSLTVAENLTLAGTLENVSGATTWSSDSSITLQDGTIQVDGTSTLLLAGSLTGAGG